MQTALLEEASKRIPLPQVLINVISRRVRQLSQGRRPLVEVTPKMGFADTALKEVIEGKLVYEVTQPSAPELALLRLPRLDVATGKKAA
jgi:DNA-directed RNA polymerase subunit omega